MRGLLRSLTSVVQTPACHSASQLQVGQAGTAVALGAKGVCVWGVAHSIQPSVLKIVFLGCSGLFLAGPAQVLGIPPGLWRLCPGPVSPFRAVALGLAPRC